MSKLFPDKHLRYGTAQHGYHSLGELGFGNSALGAVAVHANQHTRIAILPGISGVEANTSRGFDCGLIVNKRQLTLKLWRNRILYEVATRRDGLSSVFERPADEPAVMRKATENCIADTDIADQR